MERKSYRNVYFSRSHGLGTADTDETVARTITRWNIDNRRSFSPFVKLIIYLPRVHSSESTQTKPRNAIDSRTGASSYTVQGRSDEFRVVQK